MRHRARKPKATAIVSAGILPLLSDLWNAIGSARRKELYYLCAAMLAYSALELATLATLQQFLIRATGPTLAQATPLGATPDGTGLVSAWLLFLVCAAAAAGIRLLTLWYHDRLVLDVASDFSTRLFSNALQQRYSDHARRETAELFAGLDKSQLLVNGVLSPLAQAMVSGSIAALLLAYLAWIAPGITFLGVLSLAALYSLLGLASRSRLRQGSIAIARLASARMKAVHEAQSAFRDIVLGQAQRGVRDHFERVEHAYRRAQIEARFFASAPRYLVELAMLIGVGALALYWSGVAGGLAAIVPLAGVLALAGQRLIPLVNNAYSAWSLFVSNSAMLTDVLTLLQRPCLPLPDRLVPPLVFERDILLDDVSLRYPGRDDVLSGVCLRIPKGARVGIMGETGSGKSSMLDLILGLIEPSSGQIRIDGNALDSTEKRSAWMATLAFVPQAIYLPDWPLREVVAFPQPAAQIDAELMRSAITGAHLSDFIASLPEGLDTHAGDCGIRLSGGQRQRIALARALYRRASVLVLDEATGQLDRNTEDGVLATLQRIDRSVTIIVVAHRASALRDCDFLVELKHGKIKTTANASAFEGSSV